MNLNKAIILGRVTDTPQLASTQTGKQVTNFSVATNKVWTNSKGEKQNDVEFHRVIAWGRTAEVAAQYLVKGSMVLVEGELQTRDWKDKAGVSHKSTEIVASHLQLGPKPDGAGQQSTKAEQSDEFPEPTAENTPVIDLGDDIKPEDLPF